MTIETHKVKVTKITADCYKWIVIRNNTYTIKEGFAKNRKEANTKAESFLAVELKNFFF